MSSSTNRETTSSRRPLPGWGRDSSQVAETLRGSPDAPQAPVGNTTGQRNPLPGWSQSPIPGPPDEPTNFAFEFQSFPEGDDAPGPTAETTPNADSVLLEPTRASRAALPGWSANSPPASSVTDNAEPAVDFVPVANLVADDAPRRRRRAELLGMGAIFSIALHFAAATLLATASYDLWSEPLRNWVEARLETEVPLELPELEIADVELADPADRETSSGLAINAQSVGAEKSAIAEQKMAPLTFLDAIDIETVAPRPMFDIPAGLEIDQRIVVQGTTGDSLLEVEAALDRITHEIATQLQESKVLVVWLLDASDSLKSQRTRIADRLDRVYRELGALEENGRVLPRHDQGLTSAVVAYGNQTTFLTNEPTSEFERVRQAVRSVPSDPTGVENVFTAVEQVLKRWGKLRTTESRSVMLVVVTDETGDDFAELERSILLCRHTGAKAYVVGPSAIFGRRQGFVPYVAPEDGKTYQLPVDLGPESYALEVVQMPFWFAGPQHEFLSSSMGPYGLSRLVRETGGVYFQTTLTTSAAFSPTGIFNPADVKPFAPDYHFSTPQEYIRDVSRHPLRAAVMRAAELSRKGKVQGTPPLEMRVAPGNYLARLTEMQKPLAESAYAIDEMLAGFTPAVEREYAKETQPRWQVNYDLSLGRLLAMKVRVSEFNITCAQLKQLGSGEVEQKTNHWIFRPSAEQFAGGAASRRMARESERLLKRVVETAPGTPWAVWAQRELSQPLGVEVLHRFDPPPKPAEQRPAPPAAPATPGKKQVQLANDPMKRPPPARPTPPPPPPKLPKL